MTLGNEQRVLRNHSAVVFANCSEPCSVIASGHLGLGHGYDLPHGGDGPPGRRSRIKLNRDLAAGTTLERALSASGRCLCA